MTPIQIYFKAKYISSLPVDRLTYTLKDKEGTIQLWGGSLDISFHDNFEENIQKIEAMEKTEGFMFWNLSTEGEKFYRENWNVIGKCLANMILNQK